MLPKKKKLKRFIATRRGTIKVPVFMPIATKGAVKSLTPEDLKSLGAQIILGNTYHLWLRPGEKIIKRAGSLHNFMNWHGPILTDSGGYQIFSLGKKSELKAQNHSLLSFPRKRESKVPRDNHAVDSRFRGNDNLINHNLVKITDAGVVFRDPIDGHQYFLTPEKSIQIQLDLGSDIIMVLDHCPPASALPVRYGFTEGIPGRPQARRAGPPYPATKKEVALAVRRTTEWATRCKKYFEKKIKKGVIARSGATKQSQIITAVHGIAAPPPTARARDNKNDRPLLFGIIQGGIYKDLRQQSTQEILDIGFDGYAIGGVAVGEPRKHLKDVLKWVLPLLPQDRPRYLMGLGRPEEIVAAVRAGIDMFDCVIPTREARHGRLYTWKKSVIANSALNGVKQSRYTTAVHEHLYSSGSPRSLRSLAMTKNFYETIQITNAKFAKDFQPIDKNCSCYTCQNFTRAYLHHLFKIQEPLALRLATLHNLKFYLELMDCLRKEG